MRVSLVLWAVFCPIAAVMAYLITFEEYRHHFPDRSRVIRESLRTALFTLVVFAVLGVLVAWAMARIGQ